MASNYDQRRPSGTVSLSPDVSDDDNDIKMPASVSRGVDVDGNAALHDRSHQRFDGNEETQIIPSTSSTNRTHDDRGHASASSSSRSKKKTLSSPAGSGARKRKFRRRRSEMTAEELAEADRERRRANVNSATASRKRQKAELETLRIQANQLQVANFAVMRENIRPWNSTSATTMPLSTVPARLLLIRLRSTLPEGVHCIT